MDHISAIQQPDTTRQSAIAKDVLAGLSQTPKRLPSKYFYDERGDKLFQDIMNMPSYYLTDAEHEIFETHKNNLLEVIGTAPFELIELGAGDGSKTKVLLQHFLSKGVDFTYRPIDISPNVLIQLEHHLKEALPSLKIDSIPGDYFEKLGELKKNKNIRKVALFLGANIGNYTRPEATNFLTSVGNALNPGDFLMVGFDLMKDPQIILDAYNDKEGITADFNLNLLDRLNRELGANFDREAFKHWETYHPITGATKSYLISTEQQTVYFSKLGKTIDFDAWEAIDVELSLKYDLKGIEAMAHSAYFEVVQHFYDSRQYFVDSLWQKRS
ncbi:MAG: L-histidine N(alpha)-methyltransferase [Bacteroidota bacterium]